MQCTGVENIPKEGPLVLASNHISLLDPPVIGTCANRKVHFMAKQELFVPVLGYIYRLLGAFPVRRGGADRAAIKQGIDILQSGEVLAIFPEGTRSKTGKLGKAAPGALMMASKTGAAIVPSCVIGTDLKRSGKLWPKVTVRFGKPIYFPEGVPLTKELLSELTEEMMRRIAALQSGEE
ncbi:MAG: lysophospholipid acyltransferase family protein [Acidaminococcaceae bacterium]|nr:lysophospholipid acyltransferase family protein [Acidaminococcaceae bacterium]